MDDKMILQKYHELKSRCDNFDFEGTFMNEFIEACAKKRQAMIDERIVSMENDMTILPPLPVTGPVELRLLLNTMVGIYVESDENFLSNDSTIASTNKATVDKSQVGPEGETTLIRVVAEQLGTTTLRDKDGRRTIDVHVLMAE